MSSRAESILCCVLETGPRNPINPGKTVEEFVLYRSDLISVSPKVMLSVMERGREACAVAISIPSLEVVSTTLPCSSLEEALKTLKSAVERRNYVPVSRADSPAERSCLAEAEKRGWKVAGEIHDFCAGNDIQFSQRLDLLGLTMFQRKVLLATKSIPRGKTASYSWVAEKAGFPRACRAVGNVMARNPFPPIVPCHRVVRSSRELGNFGNGTPLKKKLLLMEGVEFDGNLVSAVCLLK